MMHCLLKRAIAHRSNRITQSQDILPFKLKPKNPTEEIKNRFSSYFNYNDEQSNNLIKAFPYILIRDMILNTGAGNTQTISGAPQFN